MTEVRYHCPRCGAVAELDREGYLADKSVTPDPLDGWEYAATYDEFEDSAEPRSADHSSGQGPREDADGVEIVCGAAETDGEGCGEVYYLSFVKFEDGEEVEPRDPRGVAPGGPTVPARNVDRDDGDDENDARPRFDFEP